VLSGFNRRGFRLAMVEAADWLTAIRKPHQKRALIHRLLYPMRKQ